MTYSPTGYWANYVYSQECREEIAADGRTPELVLSLPIVRWTEHGTALVSDSAGELVPFRDGIPRASYVSVTVTPKPWSEA